MKRNLVFTLALIFALALGAFVSAPAKAVLDVTGASVVPVLVAGNPSCTGLGYVYGFRVEPPTNGPRAIIPGATLTLTSGDGVYWSWSTVGMPLDAVIVKGGNQANVYMYSPESSGDLLLNAPVNASGKPAAAGYIEVCYDYELRVKKTATPSFKRTIAWDIEKSVTPDTWNLFNGDNGTSEYTVEVFKSFVDSDWKVIGDIHVKNPDPGNPAVITGVTDVVSPAIAAAVTCPVTFPYTLAADGSFTCTYSADLPDGTDRTNTATATTSAESKVGTGSNTIPFSFSAVTPVMAGLTEINVDDTNGSSWLFTDSGSVTYTKTFFCGDDAGEHDNTATIRETGDFSSAKVTVNCYTLNVKKTADTSFKRTWEWTIDKIGSTPSITDLGVGEFASVDYSVTVSASPVDSDWLVSGNIHVNNPAPIDAVLNSIDDVVLTVGAAGVVCPVTFPYTLPAGDTLTCTYSLAMTDPAAGFYTNEAIATLQNHDYDKDGIGTPAGTTPFAGYADFSFGAPTEEIDECIDVTDDQYGFLGTVCAGDAPVTFTYSLQVGPYETCGEFQFVNIASFVTNDTATTGSDSWTVDVSIVCGGCTYTIGYWKTHSIYGPAPYDDTWALLGEDTIFFLSGQSHYNVFHTSPSGNAYYILAHQYIGAILNQLDGAYVPPEVQTALNSATALFQTYTPAQIAALRGSSPVRQQFVNLGALLDMYNNGLIGPGHCD